MDKKNLKIKLAITISVLILFYLTILILLFYSNKYYVHFDIFKIITISLPVICGVILSLNLVPFLKSKIFGSIRKRYYNFAFYSVNILALGLTIFFLATYLLSFKISVSVNGNAIILDEYKGVTRRIGLVQKDELNEFLLINGNHILIIKNENQSIVKKINSNDKGKTYTIDFKKIEFEKLSKTNNSTTQDTIPSKNTILKVKTAENKTTESKTTEIKNEDVYLKLFKKDEEKENLWCKIQITSFEIDNRYSLYERINNDIPYFKLSFNERTFFENTDRSNILDSQHSDYSDFIRITNKIAKGENLTDLEQVFLQKSKPVFNITIYNSLDESILISGIGLNISSIERPLGGGTRILKPEIMYEIDVPSKTGDYIFDVKYNPIEIQGKSHGKFLLGLNSTNKHIVKDDIVMYPQLDYIMDVYFVFGTYKSEKITIQVLL